jgi:hypothetical protein
MNWSVAAVHTWTSDEFPGPEVTYARGEGTIGIWHLATSAFLMLGTSRDNTTNTFAFGWALQTCEDTVLILWPYLQSTTNPQEYSSHFTSLPDNSTTNFPLRGQTHQILLICSLNQVQKFRSTKWKPYICIPEAVAHTRYLVWVRGQICYSWELYLTQFFS